MSAYAQAPPDGYQDTTYDPRGPPRDTAEEEWMRNFFQPQPYDRVLPPQRPRPDYYARGPPERGPPVRGPDPRGPGPDLYASTNSVGSDGALSVLSNAEDFSFDPSMVPPEWYAQQPQYEVFEFVRPSPQMPAMQQRMMPVMHQPMVPYGQPMPVPAWGMPQPRVEYVQQPQVEYVQQPKQQMPVQTQQHMPVQQRQAPVIATIGVALWQQGRYFAVASITPGSHASISGLKVGDAIRKIDGYNMNGCTLDQANTLLRGPQGSVVEVRTTWNKYTVVRDCAATGQAQPQPQEVQVQVQMPQPQPQPQPVQYVHRPQQVEYVQGPPQTLQYVPQPEYVHMGKPPVHYVQGPRHHQYMRGPPQYVPYEYGPYEYAPQPQHMPYEYGPPPQHLPYEYGPPPQQMPPYEYMPPQPDFAPRFSGLPGREPANVPPPSRGAPPPGYGPPRSGYGPPRGGDEYLGPGIDI